MTVDGADPRVAVVIITHNRRDELLHTLEELLDLPEHPPIYVVDNDCRDGTCAAVAERFPQVNLLSGGGNVGAAGRNIGVEQARARYIAFCDDDTWWAPGALRQAADLFDRLPRLGVITGRILVGPEEREDPTCALLAESPVPRKPGMPGPALVGFMAGASLIRRAAFCQCGGYERRFFIGGEEELLALDLLSRGWWLCYVPELIVHHHPSEQRSANTRRWHLIRNRLWCAWLRRPLGIACRRTLRTICSEPWDSLTLRALASALTGLPWVLRNRRVVSPEIEGWLRMVEQAPAEASPPHEHALEDITVER